LGHVLQHPDAIEPGMDYDNPHYLKIPGRIDDLKQLIGLFSKEPSAKDRIWLELSRTMDSLDVVNSDMDIGPNKSLLSPLLKYLFSEFHY
jgi:hypothetical protein